MKGLTSLAVLTVVLLGLGSYIYFYQPTRPGSGNATPKAIDIPKDEIEQLVIKSASGDVTTVVRTGGRWHITAPLAAPADEALVASIVTRFSNLETMRIVDEHPTELGQYGLAPAQVEVTLNTSGAAGTLQLLIGAAGPTGGVYAKVSSSPRLFLIAGDAEDAANKTTFDLRDKAVFKIDRDTIDRVTIVAAGHTVELVKQGVEWEMTRPLRMSTELGVISQLITSLTSLRATSYVAPDAADSAHHRLDEPVATVTVVAGSSSETLQVGARADESNSYARRLSQPIVFTIPAAIADALKNEPAHYRRKDVFYFQTVEATRLEVVRNGQAAVYERATEPGTGYRWRELSPRARDVEPATIEQALSKLSYLRALTFVPRPAGLTRGAGGVSVLVNYDEGRKSETVELATLGPEPFAVRADWPDAAKLDASAYALLIAALDDLQK